MTVVATFVSLLWQRLRRDRLALGFTFGLPIAVAAVMVGIYTVDHATVGLVVGTDSGPVARDIEEELGSSGLVEVRRYDDRASLDRAIRRREVVAGAVVPAHALEGTDAATATLVGAPGVETPSGVRSVVEAAVSRTAAKVQIGRTSDPGASPERALAIGGAALAQLPDRPFEGQRAQERRDEAATTALAAALVLFVFTNTLGGASSLAELRQLGVLARARTTPASLASITLGYGLGLASYALVQAGLMVGTGRLLFGVRWASWPSLLVVVLVVAIAAAALAVLVATLLPSPELGTTVAGPVGFLLGMLGGCVWPLEIVSPALQRLGHLTPQAWAVDALDGTAVTGGDLGGVGRALGVLTGTAVVVALLGGWRLVRYTRRA